MKTFLPYLGMVLAQCAQVGLIILSKQAMSSGMTNFSFIFYSNALASLILLPSSFLFHRRSTRPPITFSLLGGFFLLGVLGFSAQMTGYAGIYYTSASFASAMLNLIPGFTFILAVIFRMEKVGYTTSTAAKILGTVVSIAGAFMLTLYRGPQILKTSVSKSHFQHLHRAQTNWVIGGLLLTLDCMASSAYIIVQAITLKHFPAELIIVFFYCFFAAILSAVVSLIVEKDLSSWDLRPRVRLLAVLYSGVFGSAFQVSVTMWCVRRMGPLFVAVFHPLGIAIAGALGIIFLNDALYLGSLMGSIIIVFGFYLVMWGKVKDTKVDEMNPSNNESREKAPLLQIEGNEIEP